MICIQYLKVTPTTVEEESDIVEVITYGEAEKMPEAEVIMEQARQELKEDDSIAHFEFCICFPEADPPFPPIHLGMLDPIVAE
jgi:hypothetical protein